MARPIRFLHAGDLHLERPPGGVAELPAALASLVADAPYRAAERVFDAALKHEVDFLLLAGDVVDPHAADLRALVFLEAQFQRLLDHAIRIYWAGGPHDRFEHFVDAWPLADGVHRFPLDRIGSTVHHRGGEPLVCLLGTSSEHRRRIAPLEFHGDDRGLFTLAVAHGTFDALALVGQGVDYWALGGVHSRQTLATEPAVVHYCGTSQGRSPAEAGPRGCTLVQLDETRAVRTTFIPTDAVRYLDELITLDESATAAQLFETLSHRAGELSADPFGPQLLVRWTVVGSRSLAGQLRSGKAVELVARMRDAFATRRPAVWTLGIESRAHDDVPDDLYEEETLLGEFLRTLRHYEVYAQEPLSLEGFLAERHVAGRLGPLAALDDPEIRRRALAEAAALGVALLGPREASS